VLVTRKLTHLLKSAADNNYSFNLTVIIIIRLRIMIFILDRCYILWICILIVVLLPVMFSFVEPSKHHFKCYHHHHQYPKDFLLKKYHVYDRGYLLTALKSTNGYVDTSDSDRNSSGIDDNASTSINHSNNQHKKIMIEDDNNNYNNSFQHSTSNFINQYKLKVFSWASLLLLIIFLRPFLPILIFTFYFTVIGNSIIDRLQLLYMYLYQLIERKYHHIMDITTKSTTTTPSSSASSIHMSTTTTIPTITDITPSPTLITSTTPLPIVSSSSTSTSSSSSSLPLATNNNNYYYYNNNDMKNKMKNIPRKVFATIYSVLLLACIGRFGFYLVPRIIKESQYVINIVKSEDPYKLLVTFISNSIGFETIARIENLLIKLSDREALKFAGYFISTTTSTAANAVITGDNSNKILPLQNSITLRFGKLLQFYMTGYLNKIMLLTSKLITNSTSAFINATLGLIFSLMVSYNYIHITIIVVIIIIFTILFSYIDSMGLPPATERYTDS